MGSQKKYPNQITVLLKKHRLWQRYIETKKYIIFRNTQKLEMRLDVRLGNFKSKKKKYSLSSQAKS